MSAGCIHHTQAFVVVQGTVPGFVYDHYKLVSCRGIIRFISHNQQKNVQRHEKQIEALVWLYPSLHFPSFQNLEMCF